MNLNQIRYLLAIHKYSSITKAARHLFVSAPSVSNAIKNLEEELNCSLLVRHYTGVSFTEEGKEAVKLMEEISERLQKLYLLDQNKDVALVGEILVGVSLHIKAALILPAYLQLKRDYPAITMEMIDARSHEIVNQVIQGKLNIGVIHFTNVDESTFIEKIKQNDLTFSKLYEGKMRFVVRDGHPLVAAEKLTTKAVLQFPLINYYKTDFTKAHYKYFQSYETNCDILQLNDRDMYRDQQHNTDAVSTMPSCNKIGSIKQFSGLTFLCVPDLTYRYTIGWIHNSTPLTNIEKIVIDILEKEALHFKE